MRIFLIGFMGSGKTVAGKKIASRLGWDFVDLDKLFKERYQTTIHNFFITHGEAAFREKEQKLLHETLKYKNAVISTGGGASCYSDNMSFMNSHGVSIYLKTSPDSLIYRLSRSKTKRPLIEKLNDVELSNYVKTKLAEREPFYHQAHHTVKGENLNISEILEIIKSHGTAGT